MDYDSWTSQQPSYSHSHIQLEHEIPYDAQRQQQQQQYPYSFSDYPFPSSYPQQQQPAYQQPYQSASFNFQSPSEYLTPSPPVQEPYQLPASSLQQKQPYYQPPVHKRPRPDDDSRDDDQDVSEPHLDVKDTKTKSGACQRCKSLKVRCEFKTDTDPCKRCLNGGHECVIPGRKKRRTPPKREHLLNQIREQAEQIKKLMGQLEETNKTKKLSISTSPSSPTSPVLSPSAVLSPSGSYTSSFSDAPTSAATVVNAETNKAVEDWLSKARDSLAEFDEFIGAGMPKSYIVAVDPEETPSSDDEWTDAGDDITKDYEISVVSDEESSSDQHPKSITHKRSFTSSVGSGMQVKKKDDKLATLPSEAVPFGLMAGMSLRNQKKRTSSGEIEADPESDKGFGVANEGFFRSSPAPDPRRARIDFLNAHAPHILTRKIITIPEAEELFKIYYDTMNLSLSLLDPVLYTAARTFQRSPFMFTVICALASRFYQARPGLHTELMRYAQLAAGTALIGGSKNIELCIGYILLSLYPVPTKRWEDERGWLYLGLAIRIAVDLNLHLPNTAKPQNELHAREQLNRTRVWLNCHNLDRSTGSQYGKAPIISNLDYTACHSQDWWKRSEYNFTNFDIHICVYNEELRAMARFISRIYNDPNHPTGLNKDVPFEQLAADTDDEFQLIANKWFAILDQTDMADEQNRFRTGLLRLAFPYARLVALSFGFQFGKHSTDAENPFFFRCLAAATDVVHGVVHGLAVSGPTHKTFLSRGPDAQRVFLTFAAAFLVKLLQPKFATYLTAEKRQEMLGLVQSAINLLEEIAIDDRHGPRLYARFLKGLLAKVDTSSPASSKTVRGKNRGSKSNSSDQALEIHDSPQQSPASTRQSLSPRPNYASLSFDQFAPPGGMADPFARSSNTSHSVDMSDFFYPPLAYDNDIMQGMQSLNDPAWQDVVSLPGLNLMAQFQNQPQTMMYNNYMPS